MLTYQFLLYESEMGSFCILLLSFLFFICSTNLQRCLVSTNRPNQSNCSFFAGGSQRKKLEDQIPNLFSVVDFVCGQPGMSARQSKGPISLKREKFHGTKQ